jgi:hypothetical protein
VAIEEAFASEGRSLLQVASKQDSKRRCKSGLLVQGVANHQHPQEEDDKWMTVSIPDLHVDYLYCYMIQNPPNILHNWWREMGEIRGRMMCGRLVPSNSSATRCHLRVYIIYYNIFHQCPPNLQLKAADIYLQYL